MIARGTGVIAILLGSFLLAVPPSPAEAAQSARQANAHRAVAIRASHKVIRKPAQRRGRQVARRGAGRLECVPYARSRSGIEITGNAHTWWGQARGTYARGAEPEPGAVMSFRAIRSMPLGHVAVVTRLVNSRKVLIDHANWAGANGRKGLISRNVAVIDVSPANDWSAVRVALGPGLDYGSTVYPLNGFIYARADEPAAATTLVASRQQLIVRPLAATSARAEAASATARALAGEAVPFEEIAEARDLRRPRRR